MIYLYVGALLAAFMAGFGLEAKRWHNADVERELAVAKSAEKVTHETDTIVSDYVGPLQDLVTPAGPALAAIVCAPDRPGVPSARRPAAKPAPNPRDALANEVQRCVANTLQLQALIDAVNANNAKP